MQLRAQADCRDDLKPTLLALLYGGQICKINVLYMATETAVAPCARHEAEFPMLTGRVAPSFMRWDLNSSSRAATSATESAAFRERRQPGLLARQLDLTACQGTVSSRLISWFRACEYHTGNTRSKSEMPRSSRKCISFLLTTQGQVARRSALPQGCLSFAEYLSLHSQATASMGALHKCKHNVHHPPGTLHRLMSTPAERNSMQQC
jgi:hypothetical protein